MLRCDTGKIKPRNGCGVADERTLLAEPDATEGIYVQQPNKWTKIPPQAVTLRRNIGIFGDYNDRNSLA